MEIVATFGALLKKFVDDGHKIFKKFDRYGDTITYLAFDPLHFHFYEYYKNEVYFLNFSLVFSQYK